MNPDIFGAGFFNDHFEKILSIMPEDTWQQKEIKNYMLGVSKQIAQAGRNTQEIIKLRTYLDEIDRRRGLDWRATFPWLVKEIENVV
jgi:hypothetical protein